MNVFLAASLQEPRLPFHQRDPLRLYLSLQLHLTPRGVSTAPLRLAASPLHMHNGQLPKTVNDGYWIPCESAGQLYSILQSSGKALVKQWRSTGGTVCITSHPSYVRSTWGRRKKKRKGKKKHWRSMEAEHRRPSTSLPCPSSFPQRCHSCG